jgi:hypothetical protein
LPSGGIVAREETLRSEPLLVEKFLRASVVGFLFSRENRADSIKILVRNLKSTSRPQRISTIPRGRP